MQNANHLEDFEVIIKGRLSGHVQMTWQFLNV